MNARELEAAIHAFARPRPGARLAPRSRVGAVRSQDESQPKKNNDFAWMDAVPPVQEMNDER